jgi:hypothetical protein
MRRIKCFLMEPTDECRRFLRRYVFSNKLKCPLHDGYHNAMVSIENEELVPYGTGTSRTTVPKSGLDAPMDDTRWPLYCGCGYAFTKHDEFQLFYQALWKRVDTGELHALEEAPVGAMINADWSWHKGLDGKSIDVKTPGGWWSIDARCSNCTLPNDNVHKCWVRHGEPPDLTVDKNGVTCAAGAGSIQQKTYHGFLRGGYLED